MLLSRVFKKPFCQSSIKFIKNVSLKTEKAANRVMTRPVSAGKEERKVVHPRQLGPGCEAASCA